MYLQNIYNGGVLHERFLCYCVDNTRTRQKIMLETEQSEGEQRKIRKDVKSVICVEFNIREELDRILESVKNVKSIFLSCKILRFSIF